MSRILTKLAVLITKWSVKFGSPHSVIHVPDILNCTDNIFFFISQMHPSFVWDLLA